MAAVLSGEESALPGDGPRLDRNGIGLIYCFVCGNGVTAGKELKLQVRHRRDKDPFFPFLQHQEPAPGAAEVAADGCVLVCAVCHCFLGEQWNSFERSRTPLEKRMYWLKRPYQCDSRRVPQDWDASYDLERRVSTGSRHCDATDSDSSTFSDNDNASDRELDFIGRAGASKEKSFRLSGYRDGARKNCGVSVKNSPDSHRLLRCTAQDSLKSDGTLSPRGSAQMINHASLSANSLISPHDRQPLRRYDTPPADATMQDNGIIIRNKHWMPEGIAKHLDLLQQAADGSRYLLGRKNHMAADAVNACSPAGVARKKSEDGGHSGSDSDSDEINIMSEDDVDVFDSGSRTEGGGARSRCPGTQRSPGPKARGGSGTVEECVCYICGSRLSQCGQFRVYVQKQERAADEPFFPFLWLHNAPPGAAPLSPGGGTLVCVTCHTSLMQQWQGFQLASVPVLQRLYVVPLSASAVGTSPHSGGSQGALEPSSEACFLCGQECGWDMRVACVQAGVGKARGTMHFPFIDLLPRPPNARGVQDGQVHCCALCHSILEDLWAAYRLCLSEELIASVGPFLGRYHQVTSMDPPRSGPRTGLACVCYLCGAELDAGGEFQLSVNPPGRRGQREPFFPFLTVQPPAPRAKPVDPTGLVSTCALCYHDLCAQWALHEGQPASSPWSRQYSCDTFVCFFCRQERRRCLGLREVQVARLPVFLYAPRGGRTLLVDDGKKLIIGSCVDCKAMVLAGQAMSQNSLLGISSPLGKHKVTKVTMPLV